MAVEYIGRNNPDGQCVGLSASELVSFHGATPADQYVSSSLAAVSTSAPTQTSPFGFSTSAQPIALIAAVNALVSLVLEKGLGAAS